MNAWCSSRNLAKVLFPVSTCKYNLIFFKEKILKFCKTLKNSDK